MAKVDEQKKHKEMSTRHCFSRSQRHKTNEHYSLRAIKYANLILLKLFLLPFFLFFLAGFVLDRLLGLRLKIKGRPIKISPSCSCSLYLVSK